ncbi:MAG: putative LPS assembly protein LptD [Prevotellaceae bacterium]|nr:putative LPS assembly protein LptD [Prevotellaceae bacterium]
MRKSTTLILLFTTIMFIMASNVMQIAKDNNDLPQQTDTIDVADTVAHIANINVTDSMNVDTVLPTDTLDSLQIAIMARNQAIDDSIKADSINRRRKNGIDAPVNYTSTDSLVYFGETKKAFLFGDANVKYEDMDLTAEHINMQLDSSMVRATGAMDTVTKQQFGLPVFLMGSDKYETDTMAFNFKTKKGLIQNAYTAQQDGFLVSERSKRDSSGFFYIKHGRYTTCDDPNPDFYFAISRAKMRPGKDVVFGPAYLVVQDVPLPLAIPYGFFPFTKSYSSGFIMPTYGDESDRGFYLRDGGYYFAISDKMDLKLLGEIYTKGSWGISAASNYNVRYKYSGQFYMSYLDTRTGDEGFPDYTKTTSFKIQWSHRQDSKANPYSSLSASVNFATTSYENSNLGSLYNPTARTQSTRTSSVSWSTGFSSIGMNLSTTANIAQNMRDSTIALTLPDLNISISRFYPFRRKHMVGNERWYEKIAVSYTGHISNSISTKEDQLMKSSLIKDWRNGMQHNVPISGSFTLFKYLNVTPALNFTDRMYTNKINKSWDETAQREVNDTIYGLYNVYNWNSSISMSTKVYGMFVPNRKLFGDKIVAIRHTISPSVSFTYAPDFGASRYGYYTSYVKRDAQGNESMVEYSPYASSLFGVPGRGKTGSFNFSVDNNIEMKIRSDKDSTGIKKISIIDQLGASMSYNMAAEKRPWSDLSMNIRLKWWKNYTFSMNAVFATYAYELDENGRPYVGTRTEYSKGRFGRFQGMSQNVSYTLTPDKLKKLFTRDSKKDDETANDADNTDTGVESNIDPMLENGKNGAVKKDAGMAETDEDGYLKFSLPWSLTFSYGVTMRENTSGNFNKNTMRYPYKFTQNLNFSGNIRISDGWNISFTSGYDFDYKKLSMTTASLARDLHCFSMSCSVVITPYTSYNFSFRCNAATLTDALKYDKRSSYSNSVRWY